jgi:hypothetical protein
MSLKPYFAIIAHLSLSHMRIPSTLFTSRAIAMMLPGTIVLILLGANFTTINAQTQDEQSVASQPSAVQSTTEFENTDDSFRVQVPNGWIIHDVDNNDTTLEAEAVEGFGILAQICPDEGQQQVGGAGVTPTTSAPNGDSFNTTTSTNITNNRCQGAQEEVIHIIRYPDVVTAAEQASGVGGGEEGEEEEEEENSDESDSSNIGNITAYHLQKLQEVGYTNIQPINSTDATVNLILPQTNQTVLELPAKIVEMTYTTTSAPDETRRGYSLLTATAATLPNFETPKGYSILYEGPPIGAAAGGAAVSSSDLLPTPTPHLVAAMFESFELIAAPEVAQLIEQAEAQEAVSDESEAVNDDDDDDEGGGNEEVEEEGGNEEVEEEGGNEEVEEEGGNEEVEEEGGNEEVEANEIVDRVIEQTRGLANTGT